MQYITDLNGLRKEVTDLDKAISITAEYKKYRHNDRSFSKADKRLKAYWKDMHKKLLKLKREKYEQSANSITKGRLKKSHKIKKK